MQRMKKVIIRYYAEMQTDTAMECNLSNLSLYDQFAQLLHALILDLNLVTSNY